MRVGFVFNHGDIVGGGEISFIDLVKTIRNYDVEPFVFMPAKGEIAGILQSEGINSIEIPLPSLRFPSFLTAPLRVVQILSIIRRNKLDVIHVNGARSMLYIGIIARVLRIPCVWHVRVLERDAVLDRIRAFFSSIIITNSKAVTETIRSCTSIKKNISVVYNGFDIDSLRAVRPIDLHKELGLPQKPVILAVGRLSPWKAYEDLLEACVYLNAKLLDFNCVIIGRSIQEERYYELGLRQFVTEHNLNNVYFIPWRADIPAIMKSASVLAVPSHGEPFGRVIIEAWACGLPVVATNCGGPAELIRHRNNGLLVSAKNPQELAFALELILNDRSLAKTCSINGSKAAESFSIESHAKTILQIYKELVR